MAKEMPVLKETEMCQLIGGDKYVFDEKGIVIDIIEDPHNYFVVMKGGEEVSIGIGNDFKATCHVGATGANFEGSAINREVFEFMAKNTNVEWGLSTYGTTKPGGYLVTSNSEHHLSVNDAYKEGYTNFYHNHGNVDDSNMQTNIKNFYGLPSDSDKDAISTAKNLGYESFFIYNKVADPEMSKYNQYNSNTQSQQDYAQENNLNINGYDW